MMAVLKLISVLFKFLVLWNCVMLVHGGYLSRKDEDDILSSNRLGQDSSVSDAESIHKKPLAPSLDRHERFAEDYITKSDLNSRDSHQTESEYVQSQTSDHLSHHGLFKRLKRAAGRGKSSRVQLAARPKTTSTTTTSTTTSTTTPASSTNAESDAGSKQTNNESGYSVDSDSGSEDYEDTEEKEKSDNKAKSTEIKTRKPSTSSERSREKASDTTTIDPNCETTTKRGSKSSGKGKSKVNKIQETTTTTTTTEQYEEEVEEVEEGEEVEEEMATTTAAPVSSKKKASKSTKTPVSSKDTSNIDKETKKEILSGSMGSQTIDSNATSSFVATKKKPLVRIPFLKPKNDSVCISEAYLEFPKDLVGNKWRSRGLVIIHIAVVCYMFYSLAVVCERYFMPSLEEFAQRLQLSEDVAGATLMSAGSSAPELFAALLGVFVAKGDVGTGTIVGSAVFNILFVIGICAFVSTTTAQLSWWPVLRDSVFYTFTVLVLILFIYDERITAYESFSMMALYGVYILVMANNDAIRGYVTKFLMSNPTTAGLISSASVTMDASDDVFNTSTGTQMKPIKNTTGTVEEDSMYLAALLIIVRHKRLFRSNLRFQSAGRYIIVKSQHKKQQQSSHQQSNVKQTDEVNYFGPENEPLNSQRSRMEAYANNATLSKNKFSIVSKTDYELWNKPPEEGENYYLWLAKVPINYVLHYTVPDCTIYPDRYIYTFIISILWTAFFSYIMVWMVTLIGYTFGIPDSVMGVTFLAAGTSVPDCYSSIHAARRGMADMAVSNSIGSNVFDILIGLSLPWFIQTAIYPGVIATINSRGVIYSVILLFLSLIVTIYLMNKYEWNLKPRLGLALLIAYGLFIVLTCMLEFNLFGHVNPPPCPVPFS